MLLKLKNVEDNARNRKIKESYTMLPWTAVTHAISPPQTGVMLKPFLPQLQTTFVKAVHDAHRGVRLRAGAALAHLITIHTKPDPLFTELHNAVKAADDTPTR